MQNNNILNNQFISYPKSKNHIISWTKKDKIKTCDVNSNCSEIEFNITLNKFNNNKLFNNIKNNCFDNRYDNYLVKNIIQKYNKEVSYAKQIRYIQTYSVKNDEMKCFEDKLYLKRKEYDDIFKYMNVLNSNRKSIINHKKLLNKQIYNNIALEIQSSFLNLNNDKEIIQNNYQEIIKYGILVEENKNCNKCTLLKKWFSKYTDNFNNKDTNNIIYVEKVLEKKKYCTLLIDE